MSEGHGRDVWGRWSELLALIANVHRDPKKGRPIRSDEIDPYRRMDRRERTADTETLSLIREALEARKGIPS